MKAAIIEEAGKPFIVADVEVGAPREGEVLVKMVAAGVCHSDLHALKGELPAPLPVVAGHEGAGIVEQVGPGVTSVKPGDHVLLLWRASCGKCYYCSHERPALCDLGAKVRWSGKLRDGTSRFTWNGRPINHFGGVSTFSEYTVTLAESLVPIRKDVGLDRAALVGCAVLTGVGAVLNTVRVEAGDSVVVFGSGGVGLNVIQGAALVGAERIIAVDVRDNKLEYARQFGATHVINSSREDPVEAVKRITDGRGADYAFEVVGLARTIEQSLASVRRAGSAVLIGQPPKGVEMSVNILDHILLEKSLIGSLYGSMVPHRDVPRLLDLYVAGKLKLDELISRSYPLSEINEAYGALERGEVARSVISFDQGS